MRGRGKQNAPAGAEAFGTDTAGSVGSDGFEVHGQRTDTNLDPTLVLGRKFHDAINEGENGVVAAEANVVTRVNLGPIPYRSRR